MSNFKIDGPGFYRQRNGGQAEVFCERNGRWYGMSDRCDGMSWNEDGTRYSLLTEYDIVARWPRFAVGDRVLVDDSYGRVRYATVTQGSDNSSHQCRVEDGFWTAWKDESELIPDDRPDPGPEHRLLGDDEILEAGDERQDGCDREPRRWLGPLTKCDVCIGKTVREVNAEFPSLQILAWRRRLPKPVEPEQWVPTCEDRYVDFGLGWDITTTDRPNGVTDMWVDEGWHLVRHERKWTCGDKSEWRPIPVVGVPK